MKDPIVIVREWHDNHWRVIEDEGISDELAGMLLSELDAAKAADSSIGAIARELVELCEEYQAQWGSDYLAEKWGLPKQLAALKARLDTGRAPNVEAKAEATEEEVKRVAEAVRMRLRHHLRITSGTYAVALEDAESIARAAIAAMRKP